MAADFANLQAEIDRVATADLVHVDVMDNHFVPNLTLGLPVVESLQRVSPLPLDLHLMITDADRWAPVYAETGAYSVTFHAEAAQDVVATARRVREIGARAGLAVKPGTSIQPYLDLLPEFDMLLIMTVEPGFGGQSFMADTMPKLTLAAEARRGRAGSTSGCRSTAESANRPSRSPQRRAPTPSSPGRACSAPRTLRTRSLCCASWPRNTCTDTG